MSGGVGGGEPRSFPLSRFAGGIEFGQHVAFVNRDAIGNQANQRQVATLAPNAWCLHSQRMNSLNRSSGANSVRRFRPGEHNRERGQIGCLHDLQRCRLVSGNEPYLSLGCAEHLGKIGLAKARPSSLSDPDWRRSRAFATTHRWEHRERVTLLIEDFLRNALLWRGPVPALDERLGLVHLAFGKLTLFAPAGKQHHRTQHCRHHAAHQPEFAADILAQCANLEADARIRAAQLPFHRPQYGTVGTLDGADFPREALPNARVRIVLISLPSCERRAADAIQARAVAVEVALERRVQKPFGLFARDRGVLEVELVLAVNIRQIDNSRPSPNISL